MATRLTTCKNKNMSGQATMAMSLSAEHEPDSFSRRIWGWHSDLSPRQVGANPEGPG